MLPKSLKTRIRREGFWSASRDVVGTLLPTRFEVWKLSREDILDQNSTPSGATIISGAAAVENLKSLRAAAPHLPVEFYRDEIDNLQSCFFACVADRPAAIAWSYDHTRPAHFLRMSQREAEISGVYSIAECRGRGLAKAVIAKACNLLFLDKFQSIYAVIHFRNEASRKAFLSVGFSKIAELRRPALFGPRFVTETGRAETWLEAIRDIFDRR